MDYMLNDSRVLGHWTEPIEAKMERIERMTPSGRKKLREWIAAELEASSTEGRRVTDELFERRMNLHAMRIALWRRTLPYEA